MVRAVYKTQFNGARIIVGVIKAASRARLFRKTPRVKKRMQQIVAAVQAQEQGYAGPARGARFPGAAP